jgi:hypothetical protein
MSSLGSRGMNAFIIMMRIALRRSIALRAIIKAGYPSQDSEYATGKVIVSPIASGYAMQLCDVNELGVEDIRDRVMKVSKPSYLSFHLISNQSAILLIPYHPKPPRTHPPPHDGTSPTPKWSPLKISTPSRRDRCAPPPHR